MALSITTSKYDEAKVERLKKHLEVQAAKGAARYFEIFVDGLKVVQRTNNVEEFDSYEDYVSEDTQKIKIVLYSTSAVSPRNEQYVFEMKETPAPVQQAQPLNGVDIESKINEKVSEKVSLERERWDTEQLRKDFEATKQKLGEAEEYIEKLQTQIEDIKNKKIEIRGATIGEVAGSALSGIVKSNPKILSWLPGGEALAGILGKENESGEQTQQAETEASFKKKTVEETKLTEEEKVCLAFAIQLGKVFTPPEMEKVIFITNRLANDKTQIPIVASLLTNEKKEDKK